MSTVKESELRRSLENGQAFELDAEAQVLVLTSEDSAWTAGMGLKECFREVDGSPDVLQERIRRDASRRQWQLLRMYSRPTIAMVNGWCYVGTETLAIFARHLQHV
ncbi:enoyl-CoA hydratase-related protein [Burkholderia sp. Bp9140]|uniref:enoyl-CoA hydratase-related protein n=1 Tax=Burkholderia sp. Bp9140 TaxID=2184572 RepID=UPI003908AA74